MRVCRVDEVASGEMRGFLVAGFERALLVANVDGELLVTPSRCPHGGVSLLRGHLAGCHVVCAAHAYEYDLTSGRCAQDASLHLQRLATRVIDGELFVALGAQG